MIPSFGPSALPGPTDEMIAWARHAETHGYSFAGVGDSPALYRDPWITVAALGQATTDLGLGVWVTNPLTRHPVVTAAAAATADELAPGRVWIGIGSGNSAVYNIGQQSSGLAALREYVQALRGLLEDGRATYGGQEVRFNWTKRSIPIYLAAHGLKTMRLAGEVGDGVIMGLGVDSDAISGSLDAVQEGARSVGRSIDDLDQWWYCRWLVGDDSEKTKETVLSGIVGDTVVLGRSNLTQKLVPSRYHDALRTLAHEYHIDAHGKPGSDLRRAYVERVNELGVADYLLDRYALAGSPEECVAKVRTAMGAGAAKFTHSMRGDDRLDQLEHWSNKVMKEFRPR